MIRVLNNENKGFLHFKRKNDECNMSILNHFCTTPPPIELSFNDFNANLLLFYGLSVPIIRTVIMTVYTTYE